MKNELKLHDKFLEQHKKILTTANKVGLALYDFCIALKEMHESKSYLSANYISFEDYTEKALQIKKTQAYEYLKIAERFSPGFFQENSKIGITKLQLLANIDVKDAEEFISAYDIENISVKELKRTLANYKDKKESKADLTSPHGHDEVIEIEPEPKEEPKTFGEFLRNKRLNLGITALNLANLLNVSRPYLVNIELNNRVLNSSKFYQKIINILNLDAEEQKLMYKLVDLDLIKKRRIMDDLMSKIVDNPSILEKLRNN